MSSPRRLIDEHSRTGQRFSWFIQVLIVVSMVTFTLETVPGLGHAWYVAFYALEVFIVAVFTAEYLLRLAYAPHRLRFVFSFYGLVDLAAIAPFYLATGLDLRSVRILRIFRLARIVKLFRYNRAAKRLIKAFFQVRDELVLFIVMIVILVYLSSVGIYYFENEAQPDKFKSIPHSMWWAVATLTTVGYGDIYPITAGGRFFTFVVLILGLGVIAVPTGLVASALTDIGAREDGDDADQAGQPPDDAGKSEQ